VVIGVSLPLEQSAVVSGVGQAEQAAADARRSRLTVGWFGELTLSAVVADDVMRQRVWSLAEPALDALDGGEANLAPSLAAFLHHNGSWEAAARDLGVHRHTLKARMDKVERLTGLSLDSAENRVLLILGLLSRPR
jgi:purine catabolism regulator